MKLTFNKDANFSIVINNKCNANCNFCTGLSCKDEDDSIQYYERLEKILIDLPTNFYQCSITGGEPGISSRLSTVLYLIKKYSKFKKVVYSTNGTNLLDILPQMKGIVDHINISRHDIFDSENYKIFNTGNNSGIPSALELGSICSNANRMGIDITLVKVISGDFKLQDVHSYINFVIGVQANKVSFRGDSHANSLDYLPVEVEIMKSYNKTGEGRCPSCRSTGFLISGKEVSFKASLIEPSDIYDKGEMFELVVHPNGHIYLDWSAEKLITMKEIHKSVSNYTQKKVDKELFNVVASSGRKNHIKDPNTVSERKTYNNIDYSAMGCTNNSSKCSI